MPDSWSLSLDSPFASFIVFGCAILAPTLTIPNRRSIRSRRLRGWGKALSWGAVLGAALFCGVYAWAFIEFANNPPQW